MEYSDLIKLLIGLISAFGAIVGYKLNSIKSKQAQAELIKQFENALENDNKYSTCELFALIYGINMDYKDILEITKRDDLNKVLYLLKKSPGVVAFKSGKLKYNTVFEKPWVRTIEKHISKSLTYGAGILTVLLILMMPFANGALITITLALLVIAFTIFTLELREMLHGNMIRKMVEIELEET